MLLRSEGVARAVLGQWRGLIGSGLLTVVSQVPNSTDKKGQTS